MASFYARVIRPAATFAACVLMGVLAAPEAAAAEVIERLLAIVSGHLIMSSDVASVRRFGLTDASGTDQEILDRLIDRALILAEVERYAPVEPLDAEVGEELERVRSRFPSADAYRAALDELGFEEGMIRERIRQNLRIASYLEERFVVVVPTDAEIEAAYGADPARFGGAPLAVSRAAVSRALVEERRGPRVQEWLNGLRRRSRIVVLPAEGAAPVSRR